MCCCAPLETSRQGPAEPCPVLTLQQNRLNLREALKYHPVHGRGSPTTGALARLKEDGHVIWQKRATGSHLLGGKPASKGNPFRPMNTTQLEAGGGFPVYRIAALSFQENNMRNNKSYLDKYGMYATEGGKETSRQIISPGYVLR